MQTAQHWHTDNLTVGMIRQLRDAWDWYALVDALMRSGFVEIGDVFGYNTPEMALAQDEHVVQAFASQTAKEVG
jgi:hypothetical protein